MTKIFLTHTPDMLKNYYGERALAELRKLGDVRLNETFRILTAASVVLLPLTLIASVFGMNVQFPGEGETITFYLILALMAVLLVALVILFRRRGWL